MVGGEAHLYVGDMRRPEVTFPFFQRDRGAFGFKPRNPGRAVWIDGLRVTEIDGFTYQGLPIPNHNYQASDLVGDWDVMGPLTRFYEEVETQQFDRDANVEDSG